jgi:hypothetical protein
MPNYNEKPPNCPLDFISTSASPPGHVLKKVQHLMSHDDLYAFFPLGKVLDMETAVRLNMAMSSAKTACKRGYSIRELAHALYAGDLSATFHAFFHLISLTCIVRL